MQEFAVLRPVSMLKLKPPPTKWPFQNKRRTRYQVSHVCCPEPIGPLGMPHGGPDNIGRGCPGRPGVVCGRES